MTEPLDRKAIHDEMDRARATFQQLLNGASSSSLHRRSSGTRWTNEQLLFHMLFGYMIVRALLVLVRSFGRLPDGVSRVFARILNSATGPFHMVNYLGSCGGPLVFRGPRMAAKFDRIIESLHRHLDAETESALRRAMHFPPGWDPFFKDTMSLLDVYHYATQHFDFHRTQLTLDEPD
jgi:hypothetical protein